MPKDTLKPFSPLSKVGNKYFKYILSLYEEGGKKVFPAKYVPTLESLARYFDTFNRLILESNKISDHLDNLTPDNEEWKSVFSSYMSVNEKVNQTQAKMDNLLAKLGLNPMDDGKMKVKEETEDFSSIFKDLV